MGNSYACILHRYLCIFVQLLKLFILVATLNAVRWESLKQGVETQTVSPTRQPTSRAKQNPKHARPVSGLGTVHLTLCAYVTFANRIKITENKKIEMVHFNRMSKVNILAIFLLLKKSFLKPLEANLLVALDNTILLSSWESCKRVS